MKRRKLKSHAAAIGGEVGESRVNMVFELLLARSVRTSVDGARMETERQSWLQNFIAKYIFILKL